MRRIRPLPARFRALAVATVGATSLLLTACPKPNANSSDKKADAGKDKKPMVISLQDVPSDFAVTTVDPTQGNTASAASPILGVLEKENARWMAAQSVAGKKPYYLSYQVTQRRVVSLEAEGGAIVGDDDDTDRLLDIDVRVGSPKLDNTHALSSDDDGLNTPIARQAPVPIGSDIAVAQTLWIETDRRFREASQALPYVEQDRLTLKKPSAIPDFSPEAPQTYIEAPVKLEFNKQEWVDRLRQCSGRALKGVATRASCGVVFQETTVWFVNSEGSKIQQSTTWSQLNVSVGVKAEDGMGLSRTEQRFAAQPAGLPKDAGIDQLIETVTSELSALHAAPLADPYVGPAILEGRAAGVFFHEVFGHRIEGHRQKEETSGKTFSAYVGKDIMPNWLSVFDDPRLTSLGGVWLNGFYRFDNQGVMAQRTPLVDAGKLVGFLMSRIPIDGFAKSNGHGRHSPGLPPVSRQGNLVVTASKTVPRADLEKLLIEEVTRQGKPFGMIFSDISGGFTNTDVFGPQAFKVNPIMAFRLYPDGRRELVRGIDINGTPLVALQSIRAASREVETFNGVCGAESGWVPVSASAPSLLVERLEVEKGFTPPDRPPVLAPPSIRTSVPSTVSSTSKVSE